MELQPQPLEDFLVLVLDSGAKTVLVDGDIKLNSANIYVD